MTSTLPSPSAGQEQAIRDALGAFPKGWHTVFQEVREREPGVVEIGALWEDSDSLAEVVTVDTGNYYDNASAMPMAKFIAVCNPENIAALLAEIDSLRAALTSASKQEGGEPSDAAIMALWAACDTPSAENDYTTGPLPFARALLALSAPQPPLAGAGEAFENTRARTLLAHLWRRYDAAGTSMGRSHEAVVLEAVLSLLGDPDPADMALLDKDSGAFVDATRTYLSNKMAERLFGNPQPAPLNGGCGDGESHE